MSLANPWWLLAGALAVAAVIVLHTLRPQRRAWEVSSLFLWREVAEELAAARRRRKLLSSLLLILQATALALLAFALAGPALRREAPLGELAVIVDTSASMSVDAGGGTRLQTVIERIESLLSEGTASRYSLWTSSSGHLHFAGTSKEAFLEALHGLDAPAGRSDWGRAIESVRAALPRGTPSHVIVATDGAVDPGAFDGLFSLEPHVALHLLSVGAPVGNVGITAFTARSTGDPAEGHQVLLRVENRTNAPQEVGLVVAAHRPALPGEENLEKTLIDTTLTIPPAEAASAVFNHRFDPGEQLEARILPPDLFTHDDIAYLTSDPSGEIRALVVGWPNYFLIQGLSSFPGVRVDYAGALPDEAIADEYDLLLFYGEPVPDRIVGPAAAIAAAGSVPFPRAAGENHRVWWDPSHPISRFVDWNDIRYGDIAPLARGPGESILVEGPAGPLVTVSDGPRRIVRVGVPLETTDFPFRVAFPVFLQNLLDWARPSGAGAVPDPSPPGRLPPSVLDAARRGDAVEILSGDAGSGEEPLLRLTGAADAFFPELTAAGVYEWRAGGRVGRFAVSLLDPDETDLGDRLTGALGAAGVNLLPEGATLRDLQATAAPVSQEADGRWDQGAGQAAAIAVLLILVAEGWLYARRHGARTPGSVPGLHSGGKLHSGRKGELAG